MKKFKKIYKTLFINRCKEIRYNGKYLTCGVDLINDVSGYRHDKDSLLKLKNITFPKCSTICRKSEKWQKSKI